MKKTLKIIGITLGSLVGLVLIVAIVAVSMITSSGRLTKMVKKYAPQYINCDMALGKAKLTLFKTFPNVGVDIENVALINPMAGSPSDTLANIDNLIVVADAKKFLKEKEIIVKKCILENAFVNLYTDSLGQSNLNVFNNKEDNDTTSSSFDYLVDIEEVKLKNATLFYTDDRSQMKAQAVGLNLDVNGKMKDKDIVADIILKSRDLDLNMKSIQLAINELNLDFKGNIANYDVVDGTLNLKTPDISLNLNEPYLKNDTLLLNLPVKFSVADLSAHLDKAQIGLNRFLIALNGDVDVEKNNDINLDLGLSTNTLMVEDVLTYLPSKLQQSLSSIEYSGKISITEATVNGTFNDSLMPLISAKISTDKARVNVPSLPYPFTEVDLDANLDLDMNTNSGSVAVNSLNAKFNRSNLNVSGLVDNLLGDIGLKLKVKGNVPMTDVKGFLPKTINLAGNTNLDLTTNFTLDQLMRSLKDYNLNRLKANATLKINDFAFEMDTINATAKKLNLTLALPASSKMSGQKGAYVNLFTDLLAAQVGKGIDVKMKNPDIKLTADKFKQGFEKMNINANLKFGHLDAVYDSIVAQANNPVITVVTVPEKSINGLNANITFDGKQIVAEKGTDYALNTGLLKINASVNQNKAKEDFLNRWKPTADFVLNNASVKVDGLKEDIRLNDIVFLFNSRELNLKKSTFRIGSSDLSLQGNVTGINDWIVDHKNLMKGELLLTSKMLNINEIMDLTSGLGSSDDENVVKDDNKEDNPFMVPQGVDFSFNVKTEKALYDNFDLNNLGGAMTVKDGTLILQEIGFTNKAAEMQLTAMYQSPRKNNLLVSLDFHLLDVQIGDLLHMIPYIDTLVPMLKTFDGQAEFHIGADANLKSNYEPKISTFRAAADIEGKNLNVKDKFTFTKITDLLNVSTNGEYRVDSLDVQLTVLRDKIDLWPSQIAIGKYKVTLDGRMKLDQTGEYHLSVTQSPLPTRFGLKVSGPLNKLEYKLEDCKYPNLYRPDKRSDTEQMYYELKKKIADRLKENVR